MKFLATEEYVAIPEGVKISIKARIVTVEGPKGKITKNFKHIAAEFKRVNLDQKVRKGPHIHIKMWFGRYKQTCQVNQFACHNVSKREDLTCLSFIHILHELMQNFSVPTHAPHQRR